VANVTKAEALVEDARVKVDRRVVMLAQNATAKEDLETAQTTYTSAVADRDALIAQKQAAEDNVKVAKAQLNVANSLVAANQAQVQQYTAARQSAQIDLDHTSITAPVDGVVVSRSVDVGQTVAASLSAPVLFLIAQDLTKMQVDTNVSEADVGRVRVNQPATFTVDAYPGLPFRGVVSQVRNAPITVQNVVTYDVVIAVDNPKLELKPGMTANVTVTTAKVDDALRVPVRALRFKPEAAATQTATTQGPPAGPRSKKAAPDSSTVYVLGNDGEPAPVKVKTGIRDGQYAEVTGGDLKEGAVVIVGVKRALPAEQPTVPGQAPGFGGGRRRF